MQCQEARLRGAPFAEWSSTSLVQNGLHSVYTAEDAARQVHNAGPEAPDCDTDAQARTIFTSCLERALNDHAYA